MTKFLTGATLMQTELIDASDGTFRLQGKLRFDTVSKLHADTRLFDAKDTKIVIDMSEVESVDSAGIVLLVEWLEQAARQGIQLCFKNVPTQMDRLIQVSGLSQLFESNRIDSAS